MFGGQSPNLCSSDGADVSMRLLSPAVHCAPPGTGQFEQRGAGPRSIVLDLSVLWEEPEGDTCSSVEFLMYLEALST